MLKYKFQTVNQDFYRFAMVSPSDIRDKEAGDETIVTDPEVYAAQIAAEHLLPVNFTYTLSKDDEFITIILQDDDNEKNTRNVKIKISDLLSKSVAQSLWIINSDKIEESFAGQTQSIVTGEDLLSAFEYSLATKKPYWYPINKDTYFFPRVFVPYNNCSVDDLILVIAKPLTWSNDPIHPQLDQSLDSTLYGDTTISVVGGSLVGTVDAVSNLISVPTTTHTVDGDTITVNVSADPKIDTLYLQASVGYLAKSKLSLVNGSGTFKVLTTGLDSGDVVEVKISHKLWTNAATFSYTVA